MHGDDSWDSTIKILLRAPQANLQGERRSCRGRLKVDVPMDPEDVLLIEMHWHRSTAPVLYHADPAPLPSSTGVFVRSISRCAGGEWRNSKHALEQFCRLANQVPLP